MPLWILLGAEAIFMALIVFKMLGKRRSFSDNEEELLSTPENSLLNEALSTGERWEEGGTPSGEHNPARHADSPVERQAAPPLELPDEERWD
ncbi:MAG TPA: hypothetical protein VGR15_02700 [Bacteroidota bacterium]|jgi:hypothetical protein|nr:hypothetical protein [Bacteroidota bacterium]